MLPLRAIWRIVHAGIVHRIFRLRSLQAKDQRRVATKAAAPIRDLVRPALQGVGAQGDLGNALGRALRVVVGVGPDTPSSTVMAV